MRSESSGRLAATVSQICLRVRSPLFAAAVANFTATFGRLAWGQMTNRVELRDWFVAPRRLRPTLPALFSRPTARSAEEEAGPLRMRISMRPVVSKSTIWKVALPAPFDVGISSHSTVKVWLGVVPAVSVVIVPLCDGSRSVQKPAMKSSRLAAEGISVAVDPVSAPGEVKASRPFDPTKKLVLATPKKEKANGSAAAPLNASSPREMAVAPGSAAMLS